MAELCHLMKFEVQTPRIPSRSPVVWLSYVPAYFYFLFSQFLLLIWQVSSLSPFRLRPPLPCLPPLCCSSYGFTANPTALAMAVCLMSKVRNCSHPSCRAAAI